MEAANRKPRPAGQTHTEMQRDKLGTNKTHQGKEKGGGSFLPITKRGLKKAAVGSEGDERDGLPRSEDPNR